MPDRPHISANVVSDHEFDSDEARFQQATIGLIGGLFVLVKVALVHRMDNKAVEPVVERFRGALDEFQREVSPDAAVQFVGDAVYVNRRLVRADLSTWEKASFLKDFFARLDIGEIAFREQVRDDSIRAFVQGVREVALDPSTAAEVVQREYFGIQFRSLEATGISIDASAIDFPDNVLVLRGYGIIVATMRDVVEGIQTGRAVPLLPVRRAVQEFVRLPDRTRPLQLGLLSLEQFRGQLAGRLATLGILVVLMGKRLGLGVAALRDLGVAAALSGIGRLLSEDLVFAEPDRVAEQRAFCEGARWLVPYSGRGRAAALRLIGAAEQSDPGLRRAGHPLSRLIAVADRFDLLTQRPPRGPGIPPDAALRRLLGAEDLDRAAVRLLISTIGLFPVGSTVKLTDGRTAIVVDVTDRAIDPVVMIVADQNGMPGEREMVDLSGSGIGVVGTVDAVEMDFNVGSFLFA